jgi:2',3'-cyclic-nucleotide 2'-phosphodiesterase (5'-nucleotidase family)
MRMSSALGVSVVCLALALSAGAACAEVLGSSAVPLSAEEVREAECPLGDLAADAARSAMQIDAARSSTQADLALVQASQFRQTVIPDGNLTREALTGALLYPDEEIVLVRISGEQLQSALERGLSMLPKPSTAFLQVSGITVTFRSDWAAGQRVTEVRVGPEVLSPGKTYRVAMPASLAKGALGYFRIFKGLKAEATGPALGDALCSFVSAQQVVPPVTEPRLRDLSKPNE